MLCKDRLYYPGIAGEPGPYRLFIQHFMNKDVSALCKPDQILRNTGISGQYNGMATIVDPVSECWSYRGVSDEKCCDEDALFLQDNPLTDAMPQYVDAVTRCFCIYVAAHGNSTGERGWNMSQPVSRARRSPERTGHSK